MASDGRAVARRSDGKVVFVGGALPGETVRCRVDDDKASFASGTVIEVLEASSERVEPPCPAFRSGCGGCQWQHIDLTAQSSLKTDMIDDALTRIGRIDHPAVQPTVALAAWDFRTTLRVGVSGGRAALRRGRSNDLVPIEECLIADPALRELLALGRFGQAEEVLLRCGTRTGERVAVPRPRSCAIDVPEDVGDDVVHEVAAGRTWAVSPRSFFQTRPDGIDALTELVTAAAGPVHHGGRAVDLYSGVGVFAGVLADQGWRVVAVEGNSSAVRDARKNLAGSEAEVVHREVGRWEGRQAELVVADPSRSGLGRPGVRAIVATGADRVVLISCDVASMGRDAGLLGEAGYGLSSVTPVDLFPHSFHVEVVTVFDRLG